MAITQYRYPTQLSTAMRIRSIHGPCQALVAGVKEYPTFNHKTHNFWKYLRYSVCIWLNYTNSQIWKKKTHVRIVTPILTVISGDVAVGSLQFTRIHVRQIYVSTLINWERRRKRGLSSNPWIWGYVSIQTDPFPIHFGVAIGDPFPFRQITSI